MNARGHSAQEARRRDHALSHTPLRYRTVGAALDSMVAGPSSGATSAVACGQIVEGRVSEVVDRSGRPFVITGVVQHGARLGRTIGFPTANIELGDCVRPARGIYASVSTLEDGRRLPGLSYIGRRPTVDDGDERLEVFLFDFDEEIYGQLLDTVLIRFLRPDERFANFEAMQAQMEADRIKGRAIAFDAVAKTVLVR